MRSFLFCLVLLIPACKSDDARPPECEEIVEACHEADKGPGAIHDCHENAEGAWGKNECIANRTTCLALCARSDGGANDAGRD
jgi:hypothetical protein